MYQYEQEAHMGSNIILSKIIFYKTDGYNDQYYQPFDLNITDRVVGNLTDIMTVTDASSFTAATLSSVAASAIVIDTPTIAVPIANGWATPKLMFVLTVEVDAINNTREVLEIQGYTEYYDPSQSQALPLDAVMTINNIIVKNVYQIENTNNQSVQIKSSCQVMSSINTQDSVYSVTPTDVLSPLAAGTSGSPVEMYEHTTETPSNRLSAAIRPSTRNNLSPASWLSDTLNAHATTTENSLAALEAYDTSNVVVADVVKNTYSSTMGLLESRLSNVRGNAFLCALNVLNGAQGSQFTWGNLLELDPTLDDRADLMQDTQYSMVDSEYLNVSDASALAASLVAPILSAIMYRLAIAEMAFSLNNLDINNPSVAVTECMPMSSAASSLLITTLKNSLLHELLPIASRDNTTLVSMTVVCSVLMGSSIDISVNNGVSTRYARPAYADSTHTNMIATDPMEQMVVGMQTILDATDVTQYVTEAVTRNELEQPLSTTGTFMVPSHIY